MQPFTISTALFLTLMTSAGASEDEPQQQSPAERLARAKRHVEQFDLRAADSTPIERIERPLLTYGDPARANDNGTLWAWGRVGRPTAFLELYQASFNDRNWINVVTLSSTDLVTAVAQTNWRWTPQGVAIKPRAVTGAELPADRAPARLSQMKQIAGRFSGHEFWDPANSRFELRQLVQPIHRYAQPGARIHDGTVFVFAHGTNPEILLLVEALGDALDSAKWHFSAVRVGSAELHLLLDREDVWTQQRTPGVVGRPSDPYWLFVTPTSAEPSTKDVR